MGPSEISHTPSTAATQYANAPNGGVPTASPVASNPTPAVQPHVPAVAQDNDVIENEWVDAAKRIVAENRSDPHSQNQALMQLRRAYLKKRYGMDTGIAK